ncbi:nuclear transport factor 2 family protein [Nonomuraea endophytica]|uniref:nuclear transport factor 2 family protein n=1 Tax=Nonomuraea endophytica TaxID=714136 RepID=UPI0037C8480F
MTPRELLSKGMDLLLAKDMAGFADLWAADGTMEFPFAPPGWPARLDGRAEVRDYLSGYTDVYDIKRVAEQAVHQTTDPEVIIAEIEVDGVLVRTGEPYQRRYISVITVRDGHIIGYRDYWSPLGMTADTDFTGGGRE